MQVAVDSVLFLLKPHVSLNKVGVARVLRDVDVALVSVVVSGLLDEHAFEFLLVYPLGLQPYLDQHLHTPLDIHSFNLLAISLLLNVCEQERHQLLLDL